MKKLLFILIVGVFAVFVINYAILNSQKGNYIPGPIDNPATTTPVVLPTGSNTIVMKLNEKRMIGETEIETLKVLEDSRCPSDVQCIQAGKVTLYLKIFSPMGESVMSIDEGKSITTENLKITLEKVFPYPVSTNRITDEEYRFTLKIEPHNGAALGKCYVGGCSAQLCSEVPDMASTCEWRESYACFQGATCERQASGECGWTETSSLISCLNRTN